ncbi:MAG TPA: AAA family ATPase, partial [Gemmatimonadaceae bacterium]|nr:AAA family ATPase [Gemmatimonadaceae bacterium]
MIELRALGAAEIQTATTTLTPSQTVVFAVALYLILENDKLVSRERLASIIWPSADDTLRAHRLRQTILQLKKLGLQVTANRHQLRLEPSDLRTDLDLAITTDSDFLKKSSLEFLPGYEPTVSEPFREWIDAKRSLIHRRLTSRLVHELPAARHRGDWLRVEEIAERCLMLDRYNETAVLAKAEATAMRGGKRKAVSILDDFLAELGTTHSDLRLPATILRKRVIERVPDATALPLDAHFVGRESEMELLTRRFSAVRTGRGSAIQLLGEPGIGKSRLCQEFARFAELQGAYVQQARCRRTYVERPVSLFVELVPLLRELPGALGCDPNTFATLRRLTDIDKSSTANSSDRSQPLFENVREALFDLVDSVVEEKPLVIIVDDAQWLDSASQRILVTMMEWAETKRLFVILNARESSDLMTNSFDTVCIGPLSGLACKTLLETTVFPHEIPSRESFIAWCQNIAEGNPFFLQELIHHWLETGQRFEAPPSVTKILDERVARL